MRIEELLHKYFEGETTCKEEKELRKLFISGNVPDELKKYRPLFIFIEQENNQNKSKKQLLPKKRFTKRMTYALSGIAAGILIFIGIYDTMNKKIDNYVIIDGKRYTDITLVREHAEMAFNDVSFSKEDILDNLFQ